VFRTEDGIPVPAVTAAQMREVDRLAVHEFGLTLLQMMENAGRNLAGNALEMLGANIGEVAILAGAGGNGGGGLCCARHLHNRGLQVWIGLDREPDALGQAAQNQLRILRAARVEPLAPDRIEGAVRRASVVVDALVGYGLRGAARGRVAELIELCNRRARRVLSLDVPSGLDATTGEAPGPVVQAERILTLALPKVGLQAVTGELYLADIGIPPQLYQHLSLSIQPLFGEQYWVRLQRPARRQPGGGATSGTTEVHPPDRAGARR